MAILYSLVQPSAFPKWSFPSKLEVCMMGLKRTLQHKSLKREGYTRGLICSYDAIQFKYSCLLLCLISCATCKSLADTTASQRELNKHERYLLSQHGGTCLNQQSLCYTPNRHRALHLVSLQLMPVASVQSTTLVNISSFKTLLF